MHDSLKAANASAVRGGYEAQGWVGGRVLGVARQAAGQGPGRGITACLLFGKDIVTAEPKDVCGDTLSTSRHGRPEEAAEGHRTNY